MNTGTPSTRAGSVCSLETILENEDCTFFTAKNRIYLDWSPISVSGAAAAADVSKKDFLEDQLNEFDEKWRGETTSTDPMAESFHEKCYADPMAKSTKRPARGPDDSHDQTATTDPTCLRTHNYALPDYVFERTIIPGRTRAESYYIGIAALFILL